MKKVLFFDRDGTLIVDKHYLSNPMDVELLPQVGETLAFLQEKGWIFFLVTNQSGVGRGYFDMKSVHDCNQRLFSLLERFGVTFLGEAFCPHAPEKNCNCRKPMLGMWESLRSRYGLFSKECIMVGDKMADLLFGKNAKFCGSVLVQTGKGGKTCKNLTLSPPTEKNAIVPFTLENIFSCVAIYEFSLLPKIAEQMRYKQVL